MKRLLATTAIATMAFTGAASAQSLLERVLESTGTQDITGIFANTADNLLADADPDVAVVGGTSGGDSFSTSGINASITNILRGLDGPTAVTDSTEATEAVTALIGNLSTTALGAVNTGDIQLIGTNQAFTDDIDRATAGTSEAIQQRIDHAITQVGTTAGQTMLALNSALNETNVNASVLNVMSGVNASIGRSGFEIALSDTNFTAVAGMDADAIAALTGGISTTALGAVNTGTIVSGANDSVNSVITSIVGNAATN